MIGTILLSLLPLPGAVLPLQEPPARTLVVGTKEAAPFSFRENGEWRGISIDLWRSIAEDLGWRYELREATLDELVAGLESGELDVSVAALTVTAEREARIDFTHPFHPSGLGIATARETTAWTGVLRRVLSLRFVQAVGSLGVLIFLAGFVVWLFERRKNPAEFGGSAARGLAAGFWWSAVTMTTVGYGDKSPRTAPGRAMALIWMFASVITISGLTATIASTLTVTRLESELSGPRDLPGLGPIATVRASTSEAYLREERLPYAAYSTPREALQSLEDGRHRACVYDAPILRYRVAREFPETLMVLPVAFERQDYAIGLPYGSDLREPVNRELLRKVSSPSWDDVLYEYLGPEE